MAARYRAHEHAIEDVLKEVIHAMGAERELDNVRIVEAWAAVAGPHVNGVTAKARVHGQTLIVKVTSGPWRQELHARRRQWLDRLNAELGARLVREIVFR